MLVIRRRERQWIELTHSASGDSVRILVKDVRRGYDVSLGFDDPDWHFEIVRPEVVASESRSTEETR